jgi:hypothetical protein
MESPGSLATPIVRAYKNFGFRKVNESRLPDTLLQRHNVCELDYKIAYY